MDEIVCETQVCAEEAGGDEPDQPDQNEHDAENLTDGFRHGFIVPPWEEKVEGGRPLRARVPACFGYPSRVRAQCISQIAKRMYGFICRSDVQARAQPRAPCLGALFGLCYTRRERQKAEGRKQKADKTPPSKITD
jgi:hypothetical protein